MNFNIQFGSEGHYFGLTEFDNTLFLTSDNSPEPLLLIELISSYARGTLEESAKELVNEIREYIEDWVYWDPDYDEMTEEEQNNRKTELLNYSNQLEQLIKRKK